ncbi:MAG: MutS protein msh5 [Thelocarpon superellum]|nr:MAG: MutS protein msh5 [Thelocarpon superellum]
MIRCGPSLMLLTGPNFSGKSVYLKQVALIVYMAHIGSFVPARQATVGLTDRILTRIATRETVSRVQSAFMTDLQQMSLALHLATRRSLILIDEFGKGTDASDGAGLACGIFEHLLGLGDERPKAIAATHCHEIFEGGFLSPRPALGFAQMEIRLDSHAACVDDQIAYLYTLQPGRSTSSFGTSCAAMSGIDPAIVRRADDLIIASAKGEDLVAACAQVSASDEAELKEAEHVARTFLQLDLSPGVVDDPRQTVDEILAAIC